MDFAKPQKSCKSSQSRTKKFPSLSLCKGNEEIKNQNNCPTVLNKKRPPSITEINATDKKCKVEENPFEDTLFDNLDLSQIIMKENARKHLSGRSSSDNSLLTKTNSKQSDETCREKNATRSKSEFFPTPDEIDPFNETLGTTMSQLSQLFENKVKRQSCKNEDPLPTIKSENLGDILTATNRGKVESFFDEIEQSVSLLGAADDENMAKILDDLFATQATNTQKNASAELSVSEKDINLCGIDASFSSALKRVLMSNLAKEKKICEKVDVSMCKQKSKFVETGPFYGLPLRVKELIKLYKGIEELYDWQDECLNLPAIKKRKNLIYALPTSGGKTLVAEILMLREVMCSKRNALFILPYVAIVQEKVWALSPFAVALDFLVEEYAASKGVFPPRKRRRKHSIYIATIEKALGLLNSLIETERIDEIGLIVVDELHLVGEQGRGSTLEALLTKIMFIKADIQIVGMSATIGNTNELCTFLKADIYTQNFRPVELVEYVKCGSDVAKINYSSRNEEFLTVARTLHDRNYPPHVNKMDPDKLGALVMEVIPDGSCLIFCASKKNCENVAYLLCKVLDKKLLDFKKEEKEQIKNALRDEGGSLCKIFNVCIQMGIAYHHSGLTNEERRVIEDAFRGGIISVICCTSTLAAGVNLPAKRVILRQPYVGRDFINLSKYKQMVGRAGRAGLGETGESILICTPPDLPKVKKLLMAPMDDAMSSMHGCDSRGLRHLLLSCISLGVANTRVQLQEVSRCTLLNIQKERLDVNVKKLTDKVIADLFKLGALQEADLSKPENTANCDVTVKMETSLSSTSFSEGEPTPKKRRIVLKNNTKLVISKLGCAAIKGNFEMTRAHLLYDDLHEAQKSLVLLDALHLLYLVTPYDLAEQIHPNKNDYYNIYCRLNANELHTARILGISEAVAVKLLSNQPIKNLPERILNRFYLALMLYDLWNEKSVFEVSERFQIDRGVVQHLMTGAATFSSNVVHFCEQFEEFWTFASLLKGMNQRLSHCCVRELLPLMELPAVKQNRARQLYEAGYKSVRSIAAANPENLVESIEHLSRRVAKQLIAAAKMLLLEKVENLREEAEDVLDGVENPNSLVNYSILH